MMSNFTVYDDPAVDAQTAAPAVIGVSFAFLVLSTAVVSARIYTRAFLLQTFGKDDSLILVAQIIAIVVSVLTALEGAHGLGRHTWMVFEEDALTQLQYMFGVIVAYNFAMNLVKVSFLLTYRRVFQSVTIRRICILSMVLVGLWAVVQEIILGLSCFPAASIIRGMESYCIDTLAVWTASSAISLLMDFVIFTIPIRPLMHLSLPAKQRWMLLGIFCLGFFVCIISVVRISTIRSSVMSTDPEWNNVGTALWTVVELHTALICASLPILRPLLFKISPNWGAAHVNKIMQAKGSGKIKSKSSTTPITSWQGSRFTGAKPMRANGSIAKATLNSRGTGLESFYLSPQTESEEHMLNDLDGGERKGTTVEVTAPSSQSRSRLDLDRPNSGVIRRPDQIHVRTEVMMDSERIGTN